MRKREAAIRNSGCLTLGGRAERTQQGRSRFEIRDSHPAGHFHSRGIRSIGWLLMSLPPDTESAIQRGAFIGSNFPKNGLKIPVLN